MGSACLLGACAAPVQTPVPALSVGSGGNSSALVFPAQVAAADRGSLAEANGESFRRDSALASRDYTTAQVTDYYPPASQPDVRYARYLWIPSTANSMVYYEQRSPRDSVYSTPWWR